MIGGSEEAIAVAVKYQRTRMLRETPYMRQGPVRGVSARTRRLLVVYMVLALMIAFLVSESMIERALEFSGRPVIRGEGVIVEKGVVESSSGVTRHRLEIRLGLGGADGVDASVEVGDSEWEGFGEGDRIGVLYQLGRSGTKARILQTGTLALPSSIQ